MIVDAAPCSADQLIERLRTWARLCDDLLIVLVIDRCSVELRRDEVDGATDEQLLAMIRRSQG